VTYWGTHERPSYLRLRFLHDDYDFAAARLFSSQQGGDVIAAVNFAVDGGDRHVSLDRIRQGQFRARDLRLRFELGGGAGEDAPRAPSALDEPVLLRFGDLRICLEVPYAVFGETEGHWETGAADGRAWVDVVLLEGRERAVNLLEVERAAVGLAVHLSTTEGEPAPLEAGVREGRLWLRRGERALRIPVRPDTAQELSKAVRFD
jgi:hypothetical protein